MELINPAGLHMIVDSPQLVRMRSQLDFAKYRIAPTVHRGTGPANRVCLITQAAGEQLQNGLGDDFHAMPAVYQKVKDGFDVVVVGREFTRECWESVGATFWPESSASMGFIDANLPKFGTIYALKQWCIRHDEESKGSPWLTRFEQFAVLIETALPDSFSWREQLRARWTRPKHPQMITLAVSSISAHRTYPKLQSLIELCREEFGKDLVVTGLGKSDYTCSTLQEFLTMLQLSRIVVAVDSGTLAVSLAMGNVPTLGIFGPTSEQIIAEQYRKYHPELPLTVIRSMKPTRECQRPCSLQADRGYCMPIGNRTKCENYADCLSEVTPESIVAQIKSIIQSSET